MSASATLESPGSSVTRTIRQLPERVAAQIAAGEVIERPAAVLKELLENALDAGSRRITVEITGAGSERIVVHDDGAGIVAAELELACRRHATSKLAGVDDLSRLVSFGFRGEALPAIAAAAGRLRLVSRTAEAESASQLEFVGGIAGSVGPAARAPGTTIEVCDLFGGQPARRAFLAGARAERAALTRVGSDAVLARPDVGLRMTIDGRTLLEHEAVGEGEPDVVHREALAAVFDPVSASRAVWMDASSERVEMSLDGFAGLAEDARRTRERMRLFVNGRPIHDRRLSYAVQEAYQGWLGSGEFPMAVVRLWVPPDRVDVNIHPAKTEVKLRDPNAAFSLIQRSIREALDRDRMRAPRRLHTNAGAPAWSEPNEDEAGSRVEERTAAPFVVQDRETDARSSTPRLALPTWPSGHRAVAEEPAQPHLFESISAGSALPPLRMVGQLHRTFIVAEGPDGLVLVDQHGAHERVMYERLLSDASGGEASRQPLLEPILLSLDAEEAAHWEAAAERLAELGFEADMFGVRTLRLGAVPGSLASADSEMLVRGVLADLGSSRDEPERFDRAAASAACHGSVRRGQVLDTRAMSALLRDLERCRQPHSCPHGRPTLIEISADDVLREFRRK